jgi:signal transduction histidine kinase
VGWSLFGAVILGSYLYAAAGRWQTPSIVNIVWITMVASPAVSHALRWQIWWRGWIDLPPDRRVPRVAAAIVVCAIALTTASAVGLLVLQGPPPIPLDALLSMTFNFAIALGTWSAIYFGVQGRRRHQQTVAAARDAQLQALKSQLNPHFLFNCLNSVRALIAEDPDRAAAMVTGLSELLRYSLVSHRRDTVTLAEELAIVDEYIALERMRFEERLRIERDVAADALSARVPPMLVQTLVENAVKHGIADAVAGGVIVLRAAIVGEQVEISVTNTGAFKPAVDGRGEGLRNARERLRLLYGAAASLVVGSRGASTVASVLVPLRPPA